MLDILSTKARTLGNLEGRLAAARVLPQVSFTAAEWERDRAGRLAAVADAFGPEAAVIVRSSALSEDGNAASNAGAYSSILDVRGAAALAGAVDEVLASYRPAAPEDEVLVQPMLSGVAVSGVAFTHDPGTNAPYRVISLHRGSDTAAITAGRGGAETHVVARGAPPDAAAEAVRPVLALLDELEALMPGRPLDIEFAALTDGALYLLQARPLVLADARETMPEAEHRAVLDRIAARVATLQRPHPYLCGQSTVFGVMPDWNPAEIIGTRPRPLALSLYRDLLTDMTWAYQRNNYGYRNLRGFPLLQAFAGQPYVDVRLSFNSFIPSDLDDAIAERLAEHYIRRLVEAPHLHDKIEFEIVFSCYTLDLPDRLEELAGAGFGAAEREALASSLRRLTNRVIAQQDGLWRLDAQKIDILRERQDRIGASDLEPLERIYWLLQDCRRYGTLPFAGLARAGFMAVQLLRSLVATGVFTEGDYQRFLGSVDTVSGQFSRDLSRLDRAAFLERYGHLRPGTYDICSPRYDEAPDLYLGGRGRDATAQDDKPGFGLSPRQLREIRGLLGRHGMSLDVVDFVEFLQAGIEMREYAKFVFTRSLSDVLRAFTDWGGALGFSADDLSYADIGIVGDLNARTDDPATVLARSIEDGRRRYDETRRVWLPALITRPEDVLGFQIAESAPNFVTQGSVTGPVVRLAPGAQRAADLSGAIVFVQSADPGYDWLFSHGIGGLVTEYGGINSHMAIRAGELQLPAVIGAGEELFRRWSRAHWLRLDCAARRVERVS
ncbi:phosphoenolpyruvate synthase [Palleronia sediminis]|uniref:Phosphoenolpyruvate synthase n=1 Tax=Palleronia sediminis TaxID=2547833 RepID=A0A4R6A9B3_9RHOB|nr:PEP/pyruvate-binding domain-containing protein [Palleronia sediminis]TDL79402.1 phosphoenolpyruvate synthase [Palleronia sediminis]